LPVDQTVEGGGQVRVTPTGMAKINQLMRSTVESAIGPGFCVPSTELGDAHSTFGTGAYLCRNNQNQCTPGCDTDVTFDSLDLAAAGAQTLRMTAQVDVVAAAVPLSFQIIGIGTSCTIRVTANNVMIVADVGFGITGPTGELRIQLAQLNRPTLSLNITGCSIGGPILDLLQPFFRGYIIDAMLGVLRPTLENLINNLLPNPPGIAGMIDVGSMLSGISSDSTGSLEARVLPGGYVHFTPANGGLSLGLITGFNADRDPTTRTVALDSEAARCVPPLPPPNFGTAPHSLPVSPRSTFTLPVAAAFDGVPDPVNADLSIGLSETMFDLLGHHLVTSGAACLGIGTAQFARLNLATFGVVSPSLAKLGSEQRNDPMLLVTRPTSAIDFAIGAGTVASPALTMKVKNFDVDVYAFLYERYVRAFTMSLSLDVGINLEFEQLPGQPVSIKPVLLGISSSNVSVKVANNEFVRESKADLERVLPVVFDLVTPLLGDLPTIALPRIASFALQDLSVRKVVTTEDSFLAITGTLGTSPLLNLPGMAPSSGTSELAPRRSGGTARLVGVAVPELGRVRGALGGESGDLPEVTFEVDRSDDLGRELEWSWRIDTGMWRPYTSAAPLVISDRSFAFQGDVTVGLMSRVKGDYRTTSTELRVPVRIDSVAPHLVQEATRWQGGGLAVAGFDVVAGRTISIAFGTPGVDRPGTAWTDGDTAELTAAEVQRLARGGEVVVFLRDPSGNVSVELIAPFHGKAAEGCACDSSGAPGGGAIALLLLTSALLLGRGRTSRIAAPLKRQISTIARWLGIVVATSLVPGCDCGSNASRACEVVQDCAGFCGPREVAFCIEGTCVCADDITPGKIGPYSDVAVSSTGVAWVAAYAQTHGDLVVVQAAPGRVLAESWEWVDGVPDGPVAVENAKIRGGIAEPGADVGMYASIAVTKAGDPQVSYFDRETASLRFAAKIGGTWKRHVVDAGTGSLTGATGALVGMYTSLTLRSDDGRPGIAYLAHVKDSNGVHAEVRYASAQVPNPSVAGDWLIKVVDTAPVPIPTANNPDIYPLPNGLGLFVDSARLGNQAPVVVYYDRTSGALKMAAFNPALNRFDPAVVLDGGAGNDAGWSPTIAVDGAGKVHVAYVGAARDDLEYLKVATPVPRPEIVLTPTGLPVIAYQDATSHELLLARRNAVGVWSRTTIAGAEQPFLGAFGFFAAAAAGDGKLVISNWVLDPSIDEQWVEIFERALVE
jgi:hypothetical protein